MCHSKTVLNVRMPVCQGWRPAVVGRIQGYRVSTRFPRAQQERPHILEHETRRIRALRASPLPRGPALTHSAQS